MTMVVEQRQEMRGLREELLTQRRRPYAEVARSEPRQSTLVVGNSLLRDVKMTDNLDGGQIITRRKSGATFKEIEDMIDSVANKSISDIVIVGGTRETVDHVPTTKIKKGAHELLRKAKPVAPSRTLSSVLPHFKKAGRGYLAEVSDVLRAVCDELDVESREDGIHLSDSGVDRLLTNLVLPGQRSKQQ